MRRTMKWVALIVVTVPINLAILLAFTGVPKPPAITAEGVVRVGWRPVLDNAEQLWKSRLSKSLVGWMPDGSGLLVQGRRMILDTRLHTLSDAGAEPVFLPQIPRNVGGIHGIAGRDYMVLSWDTGGNELFRLYRWDMGDADPVLLTSESERAVFGAFEPNGPRIAYVSPRRNGTDSDVRRELWYLYGENVDSVRGRKCHLCKGKAWIGRDHAKCEGCVDHPGLMHPKGPLFGWTLPNNDWKHIYAALSTALRAAWEIGTKEK